MITIVSWCWKGTRKFLPEYVDVHKAMFGRMMREPHRYLCVTDIPEGMHCETYPLWEDLSRVRNLVGGHLPSCYRRLKIFDPVTTRTMGIEDGDRVVSADLDIALVGDVSPLFDRPENFVGWRVPGGRHASVFNGTVFMHRAGTMSNLWTDFDPGKSPHDARNAGYFGTDQGWLSLRLASSAAGWTREDGVISYASDCRLTGALPDHARLISFHGKRKPWQKEVQGESPWVREHWRI